MSNNTRQNIDLETADLKRDGFVPFRGVVDPALVKQAHDEIDSLFELDLESRRKKGEMNVRIHKGDVGESVLEAGMHLLVNIYGRSPAFDKMFHQIMTHPEANALVHYTGGKHLKLRGYNVRRMTGEAHNSFMEWHRDNPGEIGWTVLLTDIPPTLEDSATGLIKGSHLYPYCPRKYTLLPYLEYHGFKIFQKINFFTRLLKKKYIDPFRTSAYGKAGDFYVFINDIWHGRDYNLHGKNTMVFLASIFPSEVEFPDHVPIPSLGVLEKLSPEVREIVDYRNLPMNKDRNPYIYKMLEGRKKEGFLTLWRMARWERYVANVLSFPVFLPKYLKYKLKMVLGPTVKTFLLSWQKTDPAKT